MEADLPVVWLVMDNAGFGTIAGLENDALRLELRLHVRALTASRYRVDYAAMARACGARRRDDRVGRRARPGAAARRSRPSCPTVIQAPMENAPTPTPGHWDINDIYRKGS